MDLISPDPILRARIAPDAMIRDPEFPIGTTAVIWFELIDQLTGARVDAEGLSAIFRRPELSDFALQEEPADTRKLAPGLWRVTVKLMMTGPWVIWATTLGPEPKTTQIVVQCIHGEVA